MNRPNNPRMLEEVVGLDAWPLNVDPGQSQADIHATLNFTQGQFFDDHISFKVRIIKADLKIESSTLTIIPGSDGEHNDGFAEVTTSGTHEGNIKGEGRVDLKMIKAGLDSKTKHAKNHSFKGPASSKAITLLWMPGGNYWKLEPNPDKGKTFLQGASFDKNTRLFRVKYEQSPLNAVLLFKLLCTRDNLEVELIEIGGKTFIPQDHSHPKRLAALAFLKKKLAEKSLPFIEEDALYAKLTLADLELTVSEPKRAKNA